jgi:hypothetical protein
MPDPDPDHDHRIDRQYITTALAHRHAAASADMQDALAQLATGLLRQVHAGANDPIVTPLRNFLHVDEKAHCAQRVVDWFLDGQRNSPPYQYRGVIGPAMAQVYEEMTGTAATDVQMDVLVNSLAGGERDLFPAVIPLERLGLARTLVDDLILGAA